MVLYIVRHGYDDFYITEGSAGRAQATTAGEVIREHLTTSDIPIIISSDTDRTKGTAEIIAQALDANGIMVRNELSETTVPRLVMSMLDDVQQERCLDDSANYILVSHKPTIDALVAHLADTLGYELSGGIETGLASVLVADTMARTLKQLC